MVLRGSRALLIVFGVALPFAVQPLAWSASSSALSLPGLVAHYPLDGTARDISPNHLDGTEYGTGLVEGISGLAAQFGNPERCSYFEIPRSAFTALPRGTLAFWMNPDLSGCRSIEAPRRDWTFGLGFDILYKETFYGLSISGIKLNYDGHLQVTHNNYGRNDIDLERANDITTNTPLESGTWWHVAWTWDGVVERIYLNGKLDVTKASRGGVADDLGAYVRFGRGDTQYVGLLDDVWIFNRALDSSEVLLLATREPTG